MTRVLDRKRSEAAREAHDAGVKRLNDLFGYTTRQDFDAWKGAKRAAFSSIERHRRRAANRAARLSRRRNRS